MPIAEDFYVHTSPAGIGGDDRDDFTVVCGPSGTTSAIVTTKSRTAGVCVELCRDCRPGGIRGFVVLARNANVATGEQGRRDAVEIRDAVAAVTNTAPDELAICSTGVIGRPYPMESIRGNLAALTWPGADSIEDAAHAIMTTDTRPKVRSAIGPGFEVIGIAKGVGMIEPDMATMLSFVLTDAAVEPEVLDRLWRSVVERTYNSVSIDTDTSTSDTALILASGSAGPVDTADLEAALLEVCTALVRDIASDGEGASTLITCTVTGASSPRQAKVVGKSIINSPLVKTMVHGADPNWGRVLMAIGKCVDEPDIEMGRIRITIGQSEVYPTGASGEVLAEVEEYMRGDEVTIDVDLGVGEGRWTVWGCDLTDGYIRTNADYTT